MEQDHKAKDQGQAGAWDPAEQVGEVRLHLAVAWELAADRVEAWAWAVAWELVADRTVRKAKSINKLYQERRIGYALGR
ncbi:MAG: hypothetical protein DRG37_05550 [Deltaproteobacteria bacterium]|nr:MAG: hypothetical protein DRG37_05550 [Deltaproteobacteria bacterium]